MKEHKMQNKEEEHFSEITQRQQDRCRKESIMKLQIKEQENLIAGDMLKQRNVLIGNMWQFNDTKKRLYQMDGNPNRILFLDEYFSFIENNGKPLQKIPVIARYPLDLFLLYSSVKIRGGFNKCTRTRQWSYIASDLKLPATITSAAYSLRTQYNKLLYEFEQYKTKQSETYKIIDEVEKERVVNAEVRMVENGTVLQSQNIKNDLYRTSAMIAPGPSLHSSNNLSRLEQTSPLSLDIVEVSEQSMLVEITIAGQTYSGTILEISARDRIDNNLGYS